MTNPTPIALAEIKRDVNKPKSVKTASEYEEVASKVKFCRETGIFTNNISGKICGTYDAYGYVVITTGGLRVKAHRLAWYITKGYPPKYEIDHINEVKSDNRPCNLRDTTRTINLHNRCSLSPGRTGYQGVRKIKKCPNRWFAVISHNSKRHHLGGFATPELAHEAYLNAKKAFLNGSENEG